MSQEQKESLFQELRREGFSQEQAKKEIELLNVTSQYDLFTL